MSSHCREAIVAAALLIVSSRSTARALVVCADPDYLPYSRKDGPSVPKLSSLPSIWWQA